jgi:hypothetical protein
VEGSRKAREVAQATMEEVRAAMKLWVPKEVSKQVLS